MPSSSSTARGLVLSATLGLLVPAFGHAQIVELPPAQRADQIRESDGCEAAVGLYRDAVAARPDDRLSYLSLGDCLKETGNLDSAIDAYARAAESSAYRAESLYKLAATHAQLGRADEAIEALSKSIDLGEREHDQNGYSIAGDVSFESLRADPRFQAQLQRLLGPAFELGPPPEWEPQKAIEGLGVVLDVIENRHPNPYRYFSQAEFSAHARAILDRIDQLDVETYTLALMQLVGMIGDVHSSVWVVSGSDILTDVLPLRLWRFPEGLYVRAASPEYAALVGARITRIGSFDVEAGWDRLIADNPRENEWMATGWLQFLLLLPAFHRLNGWSESTDAATLEVVDRDGETFRVTIAATSGGAYGDELESSLALRDAPAGWSTVKDLAPDVPTWLRDTGANYRYEPLYEESAYYLAVNSARNDPDRPWESFLDELFTSIERASATRLIVDLRHNAGGFAYMAQALVHHIVRSDLLHRPGGVCVLTSRTTQSAGVTFSVILERETYAVFVGEPGAAAPNFYNGPQGHFSPKAIPGAPIRVKYSTSMIQDSDQRDTRRAIAPDFPASLTFADYAGGRDPSLGTCLGLDENTATRALVDPGGRTLPLYFHWLRPSQAAMFPDGPPRDY